jgi:hypothetical protein
LFGFNIDRCELMRLREPEFICGSRDPEGVLFCTTRTRIFSAPELVA